MGRENYENSVSAIGECSEGAYLAYKLRWTQKLYRGIKACIDFLVALVALMILLPLFLVVAIAIKVESKGPVFFTQKRIGRKGKIFKCVKFRSMSMDARHDVAGYEYENVNAYITKVGKVIRKLSIDELPQIFNILAFQMSWIGFRPSQECETELNEPREKYGVYQIRPGISGWAQVNGRDILASHPKEKAKYDAQYVKKFSLWMDIKIFFKTIGIVFRRDNVEEGVIEDENECEKEVAVANGDDIKN
jgi:O-antigen biosynthesis protein WbqP